jgi:hypothetical protein
MKNRNQNFIKFQNDERLLNMLRTLTKGSCNKATLTVTVSLSSICIGDQNRNIRPQDTAPGLVCAVQHGFHFDPADSNKLEPAKVHVNLVAILQNLPII